MKKLLSKLLLASVLLGIGGGAFAGTTTYDIDLQVAGGSAIGTITTDGKIGALTPADILSWNVVLTGTPGGTFDIHSGLAANQSVVEASFGALTADSKGLNFNFNGTGTFELVNENIGYAPGTNYLCMTGSNRCGGAIDAITLGTSVHGSNILPETGIQRIATIAAVPEPGTYGMMLAGLILVGFIVRRKKVETHLPAAA